MLPSEFLLQEFLKIYVLAIARENNVLNTINKLNQFLYFINPNKINCMAVKIYSSTISRIFFNKYLDIYCVYV